jgi:hypothetical protein
LPIHANAWRDFSLEFIMRRIVIDATLESKLRACKDPVEMTDEAGQTIGHYLALLYRLAEKQCPYSAEQLAAMRAEKGGKSLSEFWQTTERT